MTIIRKLFESWGYRKVDACQHGDTIVKSLEVCSLNALLKKKNRIKLQ